MANMFRKLSLVEQPLDTLDKYELEQIREIMACSPALQLWASQGPGEAPHWDREHGFHRTGLR